MSLTFKDRLRQNFFLIAAIALPLLLVAVFALARIIPASTVPDPQYRFAVATYSEQYDSKTRFAFKLRDNRLEARYLPMKEDGGANLPIWAEIAIYDGAKKIDIVRFDAPEKTSGKPVVLSNAKMDKIEFLSARSTSPDGYEFSTGRYHDTSFLTEVFSYNRSYPRAEISKAGRIVALDGAAENYQPIDFIGWIKP